MDPPPQVSCKCKRPRCLVCSACSRCGCGHDGKSVEKKIIRKPGAQQRAAPENSTVRVGAMREVRSFRRFSSPPPLTPTPMQAQLPRYYNVLEFLGETKSTINYISKNMPAKNPSQLTELWASNEYCDASHQRNRTVIMNVYLTTLTCIAQSICGIDGGLLRLKCSKSGLVLQPSMQQLCL